jgi:gliding motility-associated-like protein
VAIPKIEAFMKSILSAIFFSCLALTAWAQTEQGLVAHYRFDGSYADATGNTANSGAAAGNTYFTCGAVGQALSLDGQGDEVAILGGPVNNEFDTEDVTVSMYFKPRTGIGTQYLISKRSVDCFGGNEFYIIYTPNSRTVSAVFFETSNNRSIVTHQLQNTSCWQHITVVRQSGNVRLFINGELITVNTTINRIDVFNDGDLIIGNSDCRNATEFPFNGLIDEVRVYNRALNEREVRGLVDLPDRILGSENIVNLFLGQDHQIELSNTCGTTFSWSPTNGVSDPFAPEPVIMPVSDGEIDYEIAISDTITNCIARDIITFNVIDPNDLDCNQVALPNAFTPNGDGLNDTFGISNPFAVEELLAFEIYDRWGNRMFATNDPFQRWDGTYKGQEANPGVARYVLQFICDGEERVQRGEIAILK